MRTDSRSRFLFPLLAVLATASVSFGISAFAQTFTEPGGAVYDPINVGPATQTKIGSLGADYLISTSYADFNGIVEIKSNAPFLKLAESDTAGSEYDIVVDNNELNIRHKGVWPAPFTMKKSNGWVRIGADTRDPIGTLDVENGEGDAKICLNGVCITEWPDLGGAACSGSQEFPSSGSFSFTAPACASSLRVTAVGGGGGGGAGVRYCSAADPGDCTYSNGGGGGGAGAGASDFTIALGGGVAPVGATLSVEVANAGGGATTGDGVSGLPGDAGSATSVKYGAITLLNLPGGQGGDSAAPGVGGSGGAGGSAAGVAGGQNGGNGENGGASSQGDGGSSIYTVSPFYGQGGMGPLGGFGAAPGAPAYRAGNPGNDGYVKIEWQ